MDRMQMLEAKKLISEGGRPYIRRVKGKDYITIKMGHKERGFGRYNEKDWIELMAHYDLVLAQQNSKAHESSNHKSESTVKVDEILAKSENIHEIFRYLEAGYTPQQIISETYYPWWEVEACAKKYMELEKLYGKSRPPKPESPKAEHDLPSRLRNAIQILDSIKDHVEKKLGRKITPEELRRYIHGEI